MVWEYLGPHEDAHLVVYKADICCVSVDLAGDAEAADWREREDWHHLSDVRHSWWSSPSLSNMSSPSHGPARSDKAILFGSEVIGEALRDL